MVEQAHKEERQAAIRERMEEEQREGFEATTSEVDEQSISESGAGEAGAAGAAAEGGGTVGGGESTGAAASAAVAKPEPPVQRKLTRKERTALMREKFNAKGFDPNTYPIKKADAGTFGAVIMGSFALYNIVSSFKGSTDVMGNQRRRVKVEGAKFDQQKEEFMNVDGEAEVDVDIMKELRDMKEKMAGPGDKYAKDTRKYNPDFAAEHPEDEYDNKIEEILRKSGKKGKSSEKGKTGIVFASDDSPAANDELLDAEGEAGDNEDAESESEGESQSDVDASAAMKAKKDADVKRLQDLFNNSPSEDGDSPEDDMGDKRELLP
eukprot:jgi/Undpi1/5184/HiC_scaffold_19.g08535.m1